MNAPATRIFISTSHISSVYMTLYAKATKAPGTKDILLVDIGQRRDDVVRLIEEVATLHNWAAFQNFSDRVPNDHRFEPGWRKRLTRHWKEAPGIRSIYGLLLRRFHSKRDRRYRERLRSLLGPLIDRDAPLLVHAHTETYLPGPLGQEFPQASLSFFEHGQGDYIHILRGNTPLGTLHALFAVPYKRFLAGRGIRSDWVLPLDIAEGFPAVAAQLLELHRPESRNTSASGAKPIVYVLLEALDMYNVPASFWGAYIEHVVHAVRDPDLYHFVLKPHPTQSVSALEHTDQRCRELGLSYTLLNSGLDTSIAAEVAFAAWADRTRHVFCLVSSACFYLSQLYRSNTIEYHYSTAFMEKWISNAPPQYKRLFEEMKPLIANVLAERCLPY